MQCQCIWVQKVEAVENPGWPRLRSGMRAGHLLARVSEKDGGPCTGNVRSGLLGTFCLAFILKDNMRDSSYCLVGGFARQNLAPHCRGADDDTDVFPKLQLHSMLLVVNHQEQILVSESEQSQQRFTERHDGM